MHDLDKNINTVLAYGEKLLGTKYNKWKGKPTTETCHPFYADEMPSITYIKKHGINCTGVVNLMRQKLGLSVPGKGRHRGGTTAWYYYLKNKGGLEKFNDAKNYPKGTLFLRRYKNDKDRGHIAVYCKENKKPLYGDIIHSYYFEKPEDRKLEITTLGSCHFWEAGGNKGYIEFACLPKNWLLD